MALVDYSQGPPEIPAHVWASLPLAARTGLLSLTPREREIWWAERQADLQGCCDPPY